MATRQEVADQIRSREFGTVDEILSLDDYEFEQWCGDAVKGTRPNVELEWIVGDIDLAERWVDGLESLIDSADTQLEHAEAQLDELLDRVDDGDTLAELDAVELEARQRTWKPKINTFKRKVSRKLREAQRNLKRLEREQAHRAEELLTAIADHREATLEDFDGTDIDVQLWSLLDT